MINFNNNGQPPFKWGNDNRKGCVSKLNYYEELTDVSETSIESKYILSSVKSALSIMNLYFNHEELSVADVVQLMGMNRTTAFRCLATLEDANFLRRTSTGKYRLGRRIFTLGQLAQSRQEIISVVHPFLVHVSDVINETTCLVVWDDSTHISYIDKAVCEAKLRMDPGLGRPRYAHETASGKALLAFQEDAFIHNYLKNAEFHQNTQNTITDIQQLLREIETIRKSGYSIENEESEIGLSCIAVPLWEKGLVYAAISASGPIQRVTSKREQIIDLLLETAKRIETK